MFPWLNPSRIFYFKFCSMSSHLTPIESLNSNDVLVIHILTQDQYLFSSYDHDDIKFLDFSITAPICYKCVNEIRSWLSYRHLDVKSQFYFNMHSRIYGLLMNGTYILTVLVKQFLCMYICDGYILHSMYYDVSVIIQGKNV